MFMYAPPPAAALHATLTERRLSVLAQWIEAGLTLAGRVTADAGLSLTQAARAFCRVFQAVRLAMELALRLSGLVDVPAPRPARRTRESAANEPQAPAQTPAWPGSQGSPHVRVSGDLVSDEAILRRPLADIVRYICRALGVAPDWSLWSDAPAAEPGAPPDRTPRDVRRAIPRPPVRPPLILDRPCRPPTLRRILDRFRSSCAPGALIPDFDPIAALATGLFGAPARG